MARRRHRFAQRRRTCGYSQEAFAEAVGVDRTAVSRWETAATEPQPWHRRKIAKVLKVSLEELDELLADITEVPHDSFAAAPASAGTPHDAAEVASKSTPLHPLAMSSRAHLDEVVAHVREQWHTLVRTDNLLGPRFALAGVRDQIGIIEALLPTVRGSLRDEVVRLGAQYAESAAWLYEDSDDLALSRYWLSRAMEWAYQSIDNNMLAWTAYRRSQQAASAGDAGQAVALARAARRDEEQLPAPMRAAIRVPEAQGHALDGDDATAHRLLDEAHSWAAVDVTGDARGGHGSFCTASYIEISRASCVAMRGQPKKAILIYERALRSLPAVYQRDRAVGLGRLAAVYVRDRQPEQAAAAAHAALPVARNAGSSRVIRLIKGVGAALEPHRDLAPVGALLEDLYREEAA